MFRTTSAPLKKHWLRLSTYSGSRRLSLFSLLLLISLDIFVLGLLLRGMQEATITINYPALKVSESCRVMTEGFLRLNAEEKADSIRRYVLPGGNYGYDYSGRTSQQVIPLCDKVAERLSFYRNNPSLSKLLLDLDAKNDALLDVRSEIQELKHSYDSALLEKVAGQKREDSILPAEATKIKGVIETKTAEAAELERGLGDIRNRIENHQLILEYVDFIKELPYETDFSKAQAEYDQLSFWYPVKVLAVEVLFLLPLLLMAIIWNRRAMSVQNHSQLLISSHLILICVAPIFIRIVYFVYELLPHRILANVLATLEELNLGFVWYYASIIGGMCGGLLVIFIAQRTFFSAPRQRSLRLRKTSCRSCGENLRSADQEWCEFCGTSQLGECGQCGKPHRLLAYHCHHCGNLFDAPDLRR